MAAYTHLMRRVVALAMLPLVSGCTSMEYYWQGIRGEVELLQHAESIPTLIATTSDPVLRRKLERAVTIRDFASRDLALPDNASYRKYSDVGRRYVLWNVVATPELSLEPRQWCFPVAGCVNYRGYFDETAAQSEAAKFAASGDDAHIGGVPAFSTLGYFDDPILSTFIRYPDPELARLIFHELAHQVAYAKDDSVFNESFAVAVEEEGIARWLAAQHDPALVAQYAASQRYREGFRDLVGRTRSRLVTLYASRAGDAVKREEKAEAFAAMRADYAALKRDWGGLSGYDGWFAQGPNNASLAAVALYSRKVPEFRALLASEGGDLPRFYARVKVLAGQSKVQREAALSALIPRSAAVAGEAAPAPVR
ncbi:MAG: aminopeptidase [Casimicrobiaceae bacterium]